MIDYLIKNKEWIFSGIGVAVLIILIKPVKYIFANYIFSSANKQKVRQVEVKPHPVAAKNSDTAPLKKEFRERDYSLHPSAKEISDQIESLPPYQQLGAEKNYTGLKVKWQVALAIVSPISENMVDIMCDDLSGYKRAIISTVSLIDYPRLKSTKEKESFWIYGEILGMDPNGSGFILSTHKLKFTK